MSDKADQAAEIVDEATAAAIENARLQGTGYTGLCHNCAEPVERGQFCDRDCQADYEQRQRFRA